MADSGNNSNGQNGSARWAGVVVTVVLAAGAMTVQWGVVTTKLQQVEKRLDEFIGEARSIRVVDSARVKHHSGWTTGFPSAPTVTRQATAPVALFINRITGAPEASTSTTTDAFPEGPSSTTDGRPFELAVSDNDCSLVAPLRTTMAAPSSWR